MGRIRTVKPELFLDEALGALSGDHVLLFIGLFTVADREGRLPWRPARLKATLFPYREVDVAALGADLDAADKVQLYEVDGESYLWIPGFTRHQRPHPKEPASTLPVAPSREKKRRAVEGPASFPSGPVGREGKGREGDQEGDPLAAGAAGLVEPSAEAVGERRQPAPGDKQKPRQRASAPARATNGTPPLVLEPQAPHEPDRARQALIAAIHADFAASHGGAKYKPNEKLDFKALDRLRRAHSDEEILGRCRIGFRAKYGGASYIWEVEQKWNKFTPENGALPAPRTADEVMGFPARPQPASAPAVVDVAAMEAARRAELVRAIRALPVERRREMVRKVRAKLHPGQSARARRLARRFFLEAEMRALTGGA